MDENKQTVLTVYDTPEGYEFSIEKGRSVMEMAVVCAMLGKILIREKYVTDTETFLSDVRHYMTDTMLSEPVDDATQTTTEDIDGTTD